jgi:two-component system sensor histidine kinase BaeS
VAFLALILTVQIVFLAWMVDRSAGTLPGRSPSKFAEMVAADVGSRLTRSRTMDLERYLRRRYAHVSYPFFLLLTDGRLLTNGVQPDETLQQFMTNELRRRLRNVRPPLPFRPRIGRASIVVDGAVVGLVAVPPKGPLIAAIGRFAPRLTMSGLVVLMLGTILAATLIVRSPRRRLDALQAATRLVATGDLSARAPEDGEDEIAALARAFNMMAVELGARADELRAADHARRQLLADMCHELSTPLTAIRGYAEMLLMNGVSFDSSARERYLGIIEQETHRMQRRIADLLDLARLEAGGGILTIQPVLVQQLLRDVIATHYADCAKKRIAVTTAAGPGAEVVLGDPDRLEQVLHNLTANAIRHTPRGGRIEVRAVARASSLHITLTDTGEGISPEHLPRIFDRFYRASLAGGDQSSGTGLGLSIAKAIIERHGGAISVMSQPGETVFDVELPLPDRRTVSEAPDAAESAAVSQTPTWSPARSVAQV